MRSLRQPSTLGLLTLLAAAMMACTPTAAPPAGAASKPANASVKISAPAAGARASAGSVKVTVDYQGPALVPGAESTKLEDYHLHYFLDEDATPYIGTAQVIPAGNPKIIHSAAREVTFENVAAGSHTITVVMTGNNHVSVYQSVSEKVTFTVA